MDVTGQLVITAGMKHFKIWNIKSGELTAHSANDTGARCLAIKFKPDGRTCGCCL